jgi:hypothetical protein
MRARLLAAAAAAALAAVAMPAHAAAPKTVALFFDNTGSCGTQDAVYSLVIGGPTGSPCSNVQAGYGGNGFFSEDDYTNLGRRTTGYKLDATRKLTGVVYLACYPLLNGTPVQTIPGTVGGSVTILINGVTIGTVSGTGTVTAPNATYAMPVNMTIPKSLNLKVVKSVMAVVKYTQAAGITGVSYTGASASKLVLPSR